MWSFGCGCWGVLRFGRDVGFRLRRDGMGVVGWRGGSADLWVRAGVWFCMALRFFSSSLCLKVRSFLMNTSGKAELGSLRFFAVLRRSCLDVASSFRARKRFDLIGDASFRMI